MTNLPLSGRITVTAIYGQTSSYWANGHKGIDLISDDTRVYATCNGIVRVIAYDPSGWGWYISIGDSDIDGLRHIFCHLAAGSILVSRGQTVDRLTQLAVMGSTGNVTGRHLHYQMNMIDTPIDPTYYMGINNKKYTFESREYALNKIKFKDADKIPEYGRAAVDFCIAKGIIKGDENGNFRPLDDIKRVDVAVMIARALGGVK